MKSPEERYRHDAEFKMLVDWMEAAIHRAQYTPSEMREAALLASTHFEMHTAPRIGGATLIGGI